MRRVSIFHKTFAFTGFLIIVVILVTFTALYAVMPSFYLHKKKQALYRGVEKLEEELKSSAGQEECAALITEFAEDYNVLVLSVDRQGIPIVPLSSLFVSWGSETEESVSIIIDQGAVDDEQLSSALMQLYQSMVSGLNEKNSVISNTSGGTIMYDAGEAMLFEREIGMEMIDKLLIQGTLQPIDEARGVILSLIPYVLAVGCTMGLCFAWIFARRITKPILELSATAVRMKNMEPNVVSTIAANDELGLLSENMDALYQSLSHTIEDLKKEMEKVYRLEKSKTEMMQSASHELKTPIAALSGILDGMIDNIGVYKDKETYLIKCREQVEKLSFLVKEILDASRADQRRPADIRAGIEVDKIIKEILKEYEIPIREKQLKRLENIDYVVLETDPALLYRAIFNLIGNAVTYTPNMGSMSICLSKERLVIENQCSYISQEEMEKLFEPFYTRSRSRDKMVSGTGLGLYIVKRNLDRLSIPYKAEYSESGFKITLILE